MYTYLIAKQFIDCKWEKHFIEFSKEHFILSWSESTLSQKSSAVIVRFLGPIIKTDYFKPSHRRRTREYRDGAIFHLSSISRKKPGSVLFLCCRPNGISRYHLSCLSYQMTAMSSHIRTILWEQITDKKNRLALFFLRLCAASGAECSCARRHPAARQAQSF